MSISVCFFFAWKMQPIRLSGIGLELDPEIPQRTIGKQETGQGSKTGAAQALVLGSGDRARAAKGGRPSMMPGRFAP